MKFFKSLVSVILTLTLLSACGNADPAPIADISEDAREPQTVRETQSSQAAQIARTSAAERADTVSDKLPAPTNINSESSDTLIVAIWDNVEGADAYRVYSYEPSVDDFIGWLEIDDIGFYASGLMPNTTYIFKVATLTGSEGNYKEHGVTEPIYITTQSSSADSGAVGTRRCAICHGSGICWVCDGKGYSSAEIVHGYRPVCQSCNGTKQCKACDGQGYY